MRSLRSRMRRHIRRDCREARVRILLSSPPARAGVEGGFVGKLKLPGGGVAVVARELKVLNAAIEVDQAAREVDAGSDSADDAVSLAEITGNEDLACVVGDVPCEDSGDVAIAGEVKAGRPAGFSEGAGSRDVVGVVG